MDNIVKTYNSDLPYVFKSWFDLYLNFKNKGLINLDDVVLTYEWTDDITMLHFRYRYSLQYIEYRMREEISLDPLTIRDIDIIYDLLLKYSGDIEIMTKIGRLSKYIIRTNGCA